MTKIALTDLHPNPFRDLERLPTKPEKVAILKESIGETGFWDNIVARKRTNGSGGYEIAYGHNRLEALRQLKWTEIDIPVRDLDNNTMAKIMARENHEEWGSYADVDAETARSVVVAFANGFISLPPASAAKGNYPVRIAPAFAPIPKSASADLRKNYTAAGLAKFLGWPENKAEKVLQLLGFQESDPAASKISFVELSATQAMAVIRETKRVVKETENEKAAAKIGKQLAAEFRLANGKVTFAHDSSVKRPVSTNTARARANELMREERVARRQAVTQAKVDKLNLQKENRQVKQFLDACKAFKSAIQAAGKATSKFSPEAKRFTIRRLSELGNEIVLLKGRLG